MGLGKKGKLITTAYIRKTSETGRQVSGPWTEVDIKSKRDYLRLSVRRRSTSSRIVTNTSSFNELHHQMQDDDYGNLREEVIFEAEEESYNIVREILNNVISKVCPCAVFDNNLYFSFLQQLELFVSHSPELTDFQVSDIQVYMNNMEMDVILFIKRMIREKKTVTLYTNTNNVLIMKIMNKTSKCPACLTCTTRCIKCNIRVCNFHSPDAEDEQTNMHCNNCFKK